MVWVGGRVLEIIGNGNSRRKFLFFGLLFLFLGLVFLFPGHLFLFLGLLSLFLGPLILFLGLSFLNLFYPGSLMTCICCEVMWGNLSSGRVLCIIFRFVIVDVICSAFVQYNTIFFELSTTFPQALSDLPKVSIVTTSLSPPLSVICTSVPLCASFASSSFHLEVVLSKGKHGWYKAYFLNFSES